MLDTKNWNEGKRWSDMDVFDLTSAIERSVPIAEIADFLMRSEGGIKARIKQLRLKRKRTRRS